MSILAGGLVGGAIVAGAILRDAHPVAIGLLLAAVACIWWAYQIGIQIKDRA